MKRRNFFKGLMGLGVVAVLPKTETENISPPIPTRLSIHNGTSSGGTAEIEYAQVYKTITIEPHNEKDRKITNVLNEILKQQHKEFVKEIKNSLWK